MKLPKELLAAGLAASYQLRDKGDPLRGLKPTTFTASPSEHVDAIGRAVLAALPFPSPVTAEEIRVASKAWAGDGTDDSPRDQYLASFVLQMRWRNVPFAVGAPTSALVEALKLIRGDACSNYTSGLGSCYRGGRSPVAPYLADRCCDSCIADAALRGQRVESDAQEHPHGEQSWTMYQFRHWQPANGPGRKGRWGQWRKCSKAEFESVENEALTQKRTITAAPKRRAFYG